MTRVARDTVAAIAAEREPRLFRECLYCGSPSVGLACGAHRDLLLLDPNAYDMRLNAKEGTPHV